MDIAEIGLLDDADIDLIEAGIALSLADRPRADAQPLRRMVARWTMRLQADAQPVSGQGRARRLSALIAGDSGLTGATRDYDDPLNADLVAVADRERGLPVALAILYVALARRVGWRAAALGLPGHVVVEVRGSGEPAIIDPFDHGEGIGRARLEEIARAGGAESLPPRLSEMSNRQLLVRLLANQATRARGAGDQRRALDLNIRMTEIAPRFSGLWWERARLEQALGLNAAARASLTAMLETTRDPDMTRRIHTALASLARSDS
jgi:regulator of sirC expression with transglutaminase-like and TPR domain